MVKILSFGSGIIETVKYSVGSKFPSLIMVTGVKAVLPAAVLAENVTPTKLNDR